MAFRLYSSERSEKGTKNLRPLGLNEAPLQLFPNEMKLATGGKLGGKQIFHTVEKLFH